jgi:REP element-mobilizing transposase RayT
MSGGLSDWLPEEFYAEVILTVQDRVPLLADPRLARRMVTVLEACAPEVPGALWGYVVLPEMVRLVIGPADDEALAAFVEHVKARSSACLLDAIRHADDDSLDAVLRYSPVWGGAIYQVWQAGYHRQTFWTEYRLSTVLYDLLQAPVAAGLVERAEEWPYRYVGGGVSSATGASSP